MVERIKKFNEEKLKKVEKAFSIPTSSQELFLLDVPKQKTFKTTTDKISQNTMIMTTSHDDNGHDDYDIDKIIQ